MTRLIRNLSEVFLRRKTSIAVEEPDIIQAFQNELFNTFLISFPRTGSHWLRMIMELYFGRPSLVRVFYYPERRNYLTLHTHDLELDIVRTHVIYLYREPVDTIYSQLQYHKEDIDDRERIAYWSDLYGRHLDKWLHRETFTRKKTVIRYERLKDDLPGEFGKICAHFDEPLDVTRLQAAAAQVTKERVKQKTPHDPQVINLNRTYEKERRRFQVEHGDFVWRVLLNDREHLREDF
ncbi:MAG: sulfotransferase [Chloroflexi bacterium]|nr:sulfotransferase [Chloroflexota bacterium]